MLSRVYALRPYVNIVGQPDNVYEVSILYMPFFRGKNYVIQATDVVREGGRIIIQCYLAPTDTAITENILSDTVIVRRKGEKLIDTVFRYQVPRASIDGGKEYGSEKEYFETKQESQLSAKSATGEFRGGEDISRGVSNNDLDDPPMGGEIP